MVWSRSTRRALPAAALIGLFGGVPVSRDALTAPPLDDPTPAWTAEVPACGDRALRCVTSLSDDLVVVVAAPRDPRSDATTSVTALDLASGKRRWQTDVDARAVLALDQRTLVLGDKEHVVVLDAPSGAERFATNGRLAGTNDYGALVLVQGDHLDVVDATTGATRWSADDRAVGLVCRDIVVLVAAAGAEPMPFEVREQHTGDVRWRSDDDFDPSTDHLRCGGQSIYAADDTTLTAWYTFDDIPQWSIPLDHGSGGLELYREVALVPPGDGSGVVTAVDREEGTVLWQRPADEIGSVVSSRLRLRRDETGLFTLHPLTGEIVDHSPADVDLTVADVIGLSESRVLIEAGSVLSAYGTNDLGLAWTLRVDAVPDEAAVSGATLVLRTGATVTAYR